MSTSEPSVPSAAAGAGAASLDSVEIAADSECIGTEARKTSIFTLYAKIFRLLLTAQIPNFSLLSDELRNRELEKLILPSDEEWRHRVYHSLVELQREKDAEIAQDRRMEDFKGRMIRKNSQDWEWRPREKGEKGEKGKGRLPKGRRGQSQDIVSSSSATSGISGSMTEARVEPGWRINDILLAAKVLQNTRPSPNYANEAEMRRVFGLVYDVLRYKNILNRTLEDGGFWYRNGALKQRERVVWLLLYDMQGRKFARRRDGSAIETRDKIFEAVGLKDIEDALLKAKTHLAASISRLRIGGSALNLDELLPTHLRVAEGISWADKGAIASGWINTMKVFGKQEFVKDMSNEIKLQLCDDIETAELDENEYVFDPICPKMINLHDKAREKLAVSDLVRDYRFIFLERSLCLGAATLTQAIRVARLCGPVVLTHSIAPRHTGYLAGLLADIEDAGRLLAFGAGDRRCEYEEYLTTLGVTLQQCRIFSEKYISPPPSVELERATVVLATPPCSYTGVRDVVDLAVARGGDTSLLESLTSDTAGGIKQPCALLAEQFSTLKYALTRPNIQFLIYEVHTILPSETTDMIRQVVEYANQLATEKYIREHPPKRKTLSKDGSGKISKMIKAGMCRQEQSREHWEDQSQTQNEQMFLCKQEDEEDEKLLDATDVVIPDSDLFEVGTIDEIYGEDNEHMLDPGCFIAVIKRKEMMQFDSLFMIKVAESKGLFGDPDKERNPKEKIEISPAARQTSRSSRRGFKRVKVEIDRVAAPTHAWMLRATNKHQLCPRHSRHIIRDEKLLSMQVRETRKRDARRWWRDAIAFLTDSERHRDIRKDSVFQFYATRSDPFTQKPLRLTSKQLLSAESVEEIVILITSSIGISTMYSIWTKSGLSRCRDSVKMRYNLLSHYRNVTKEAVVDSKYDLYRLDKGPLEKSTLNIKDATYALKTMNCIRRMENRAAELYRQRLINGFLHLYTGQEAIAVGLKMALAERDTVITAYRCHGFAVAFDIPVRSVLAELMGRKTGPAKGKGGSMHMYAPRFYGGDGIVGGQVPIGTGIALAHKYNGTGAVSFTLYGDGAASQGQVYEAWNMAKLWNLPVVYICENNRYGMGTAVHRHSANTRLYTRGDLIPGIKVDGMKIVDVREAIRFSRDYALRNGPIVIEMITYRYFGHSMSDPGYSYRTREEIKAVQTEQDPIILFTKLIVGKGLMTERDVENVQKSVYKEVDEEVEQAKADEWPEMSEISTDLYVKPLEKIRGKVPWELY